MKKIQLALFVLTLAVTGVAFAEAEMKTIDLETCYIDSAFDDTRLELYNTFGTNGYPWYNARYVHYYQTVKRQLVVVLPEYGNPFEKEVVVKTNHTEDFRSTASYHEKEAANNYATQKARVVASVTRYLKAREPLQCPKPKL
jgi:hypothetical protein